MVTPAAFNPPICNACQPANQPANDHNNLCLFVCLFCFVLFCDCQCFIIRRMFAAAGWGLLFVGLSIFVVLINFVCFTIRRMFCCLWYWPFGACLPGLLFLFCLLLIMLYHQAHVCSSRLGTRPASPLLPSSQLSSHPVDLDDDDDVDDDFGKAFLATCPKDRFIAPILLKI